VVLVGASEMSENIERLGPIIPEEMRPKKEHVDENIERLRCPSCGLSPYEAGIGDSDISRIVAERNSLERTLLAVQKQEEVSRIKGLTPEDAQRYFDERNALADTLLAVQKERDDYAGYGEILEELTQRAERAEKERDEALAQMQQFEERLTRTISAMEALNEDYQKVARRPLA
jgi:cell division septum initiation protein DivIVA